MTTESTEHPETDNGKPSGTPRPTTENALTQQPTADIAGGAPEDVVRRIDAENYTGNTEYLRTRIDPSRGERYTHAMRLIKPLKQDSENTFRNYKYASAAAVYEHIHAVLAETGLEIRGRLNNEMDVVSDLIMAAGRPRADRGRKQGSQDQVRTPSPTIAIDASFAFAAPKDGPQAALAWERRIYYVPIQDIQSMQALWTYAYRYWITDKFLISTYDPSIEMDHRGDTHLEPAAVHELDERSHTRSQYQRPSPSEHITKVHDHEAIIDRGVQELGLSQKALENLKQKYQGDTGLVIKELCAMVLEKQAADEVVSTAADVLTDTHTRVEPEPEDHRGAPDQGDPDDPGPAGPDGQADDQQGGRLTDDQLRKVIREIENAQIETSTMQEIVHTRLGADKITNVTLDAITNAATAAQLKLPTDTPMDEVLFAVIRNAAVTIEDRKSKEEKNGSGAPAPEAHTESGNGTEKGDNESFIYDGMAKSSENELREMNPELATKLAKRTYPTTEARVNAFDAALTGERTRTAHESARATMTPNTPSAAKPSNEAKKTAKPSSPDSRPGDDTKEKTMEEEIEKVIKENKLTKNEVSTLRGLSRGNNHKLLKLLQNLASNNT